VLSNRFFDLLIINNFSVLFLMIIKLFHAHSIFCKLIRIET